MATKVWQKNLPKILGHQGAKNLQRVLEERGNVPLDIEVDRFGNLRSGTLSSVISGYTKVYLIEGRNRVQIGMLGATIDVNYIFNNLLQANIQIAKSWKQGIVVWDDFYLYVKNRAPWDYKSRKDTIFGFVNQMMREMGRTSRPQRWDAPNDDHYYGLPDNDLDSRHWGLPTSFLFKDRIMKPEDIGNYHYGAVGKAAGFADQTLLYFAGQAQMLAGTSKPEWQIYGQPTIRGYRPLLPPYGDDPNDQFWIKRGIDYYIYFGE